jgi:GT2 family glycosyltransferase
MTSPRFSIVIVAYGRREITQRCLDSLERCLGASLGRDAEVVLVDNASPDDTLALFGAWRDRATVVALAENRNFSGGCNAGAAASRGDVLVFLNNDTIVEPGMLEALSEQATAPGVAGAGLRLHYLDGTLQHAGVAMIRVPSGLPVPHHLFHHQPGDLPAARVSYELDVVTAACLAVGRAAFEQIGGFDEAYVNGWEDVDLCLRLRVAGHQIVYRGDLWLWHDEGRTRGPVRGADANAAYFYGRWQNVLESDEELVDRVFGARLPEPQPPPVPSQPGRLVIRGPIAGLTPAAAEARGLLHACVRAGIPVAAREPVGEMVWAQLSPTERDEVRTALARPALSGAAVVEPESAQLPPCLPTGPAGPGGRGSLCRLPAHDLAAAQLAMGAIRHSGVSGEAIRLLPTAQSIPLLRLIEAQLPHAEVLAPCAGEGRLRELAADADVFIEIDPADRLDRSSLTAAGAGAATVCVAGGRAHELLGDLASTYHDRDPLTVVEALGRARLAYHQRVQRAAHIHLACDGRETVAALSGCAARAELQTV